MGDQQAATIGQACLTPGDAKATLGTGAFVLAHMGGAVPVSRHRLLGTLLCRLPGETSYALEGSLFVAGSLVQWMRDELRLIATAEESEALGSEEHTSELQSLMRISYAVFCLKKKKQKYKKLE